VKVSIAMATYNGARYIREQLDSFTIQTRLPDELVVCDDCSTDETVAIVEEFARTAPFNVRIYRNETNLGFTKNFEKSILSCSGDIIFLSDQDDIWYKNKIDKILESFFLNKGIKLIINDHDIVDENLKKLEISTLELVKRRDKSGMKFVHGCCTAIKSNWRDVCLPVPTKKWSHDGWINHFASALGVKLILPEKLQLYRRHPSNVSVLEPRRWNFLPPEIWQVIIGKMPHNIDPEIESLRDIRGRIISLKEQLEMIGVHETRRALLKIDDKLLFYENRKELIKLSRYRRLIPCIKMLIRGKYEYQQGIYSFAKDILL
jgi:glycosyltransferase involved in cell wall biosynthesis